MSLTHRPCGACAALIDVTKGCKHWRGKSATVKADTRSNQQLIAEAPREPVDGRAPVSRLLALHRATRQRELLEACLTSPDRSVSSGGVHVDRTTLAKMARQGYVERVGKRAGRAIGIRYRITDLGETLLAEWKRVYLSGLPLPRRTASTVD